MSDLQEPVKNNDQLERLNHAVSSGMFVHVRKMLNDLPAADVAHILESSIPKFRTILWQLISEEKGGDVLQYISEEVRPAIVETMEPHELAAATEGLETDDLADIMGALPEELYEKVINLLSYRDRQRVEMALSYPEDTAGGLMNTDTITIRPEVSVEVVLRYLRLKGELPETTDCLFVVDKNDLLVGVVTLSSLLVSQPSNLISDIMSSEYYPFDVEQSASEVAQVFERRDFVSAPVVNDVGQLLGRITIDDAVDVIIDEAEHSIKNMGGLDEEEDTFAPVLVTAKRRAVWLGVNIIAAVTAATVSNQFESVLKEFATIAILMTIVPSMGGVAGIQSLTLVIRGLALNQINQNNQRWLIGKEIMVGVINGLVWSSVIAIAVTLWKGDIKIGLIIAAAMMINLTIACTAGALIPLVLKKMKIDPSLAGGVVLATFTDVIGLASFLGLATLFLLL